MANEPERYELREGPAWRFAVNRRVFLETAGAGLLIAAMAPSAAAQRGGQGPQTLEARLHIGEDGFVTILTGKIEEGQVVSIDVGVKKGGFYGDGARTFAVGRVSEEKSRLLRVTEEALLLGIAQARSGNHLHDVSAAVQRHVEAAGFSVVRDLVGHGIGKNLHEDPAIPNYGEPGTGVLLKEGMALAIEPMVNAGTARVRVGDDGWTVRTADGKPSAHFEHTIVVTKGEAEILTRQ